MLKSQTIIADYENSYHMMSNFFDISYMETYMVVFAKFESEEIILLDQILAFLLYMYL